MVVLEAPTFDGRPDPWTLINWLGEMDQFFDQNGLLKAMKVRFAKMKLRSRARDFWYSIENHRIENHQAFSRLRNGIYGKSFGSAIFVLPFNQGND